MSSKPTLTNANAYFNKPIYNLLLAFSFNISFAKSVGIKFTPNGANDTLANLKFPSAFGKQTGIVTISIQAKKFNKPEIRCKIHNISPKGSQIIFDNIFKLDFTSLKSSACILLAFFVFGYILPKIAKLGIESMKLMKFGLPISYLSLLVIIILGENAGAIHFTIYILTSIVLTLTQPAVALSFPTNLAGKSLTSFNLLIFVGTFIMQWGIGLIIDFSQILGKSEIASFQISFFVYFIICIICYLYFVFNNRN